MKHTATIIAVIMLALSLPTCSGERMNGPSVMYTIAMALK